MRTRHGGTMIRPGETILHYRFIERLGEGGAGVVWRALDTRDDREVAIKLLAERLADDPEAGSRLVREGRALAALDHPNIVALRGVERVGDRTWIVMECIRGRVLDTLIPPRGFGLGRLLPLAVALADALDAAHRQGVVHCDLKPRNVMVDDDGNPKILDFGIASIRPRETAPSPDGVTVTLAAGGGTLLGTIPYMAPEQVQGNTVDQRTDIYSFGVMLYEMATGVRPFRGTSPALILAAILRDEPEPPTSLRPELPPEFDRIVERCLDKSPEHRFQDAGDLREELRALHDREGVPLLDAGPAVAVLPFVDLSREHDQQYFCDGVAEEIIAALTRIAGLRVASRRSSFRYRDSRLGSREIGRRLRVRALLEGSVRRSGSLLRVNAELVDAASGFALWSQQFDGDLADVFTIQETIARRIADALAVQLTRSEHEALRRPPTSDVRAYDLYLQGRRCYDQYCRQGVEQALAQFQNALEIDPEYARAWAGVADCHCFFFMYVARVIDNIHRAEAASRRALALDPHLAEAHASCGVALSIAGHDEEAEAAFREAVRLDPGLFEARYFHARHCFAHGKFEDAARLYDEAEALRPDDFQAPLLVAQVYADLGRPEQSRAAYARGLQKAERALEHFPDDARARYMGANALVALGERERGLEWGREALRQEPDEPMLLYNVGCIFAMAGDAEGALSTLERAVDRGLTQRGWFEHDSNLDSLRALPRFSSLLERLP